MNDAFGALAEMKHVGNSLICFRPATEDWKWVARCVAAGMGTMQCLKGGTEAGK